MTDYTLHTAATAPAGSQPFIQKAQRGYGFLPNLLATQAESPELLEGYMTLSDIFGKTSLSETERQIILMTNNRLNGCAYCMAAHTTISQMAKVPADVIESLRNGTTIADPKLEALRTFAGGINETRGWVEQNELDAFFAAGYTQQNVLEVILGTSLKVMSNYTDHIASTPVDAAFKANAWTGDSRHAA